jgi:hypothetical protein
MEKGVPGLQERLDGILQIVTQVTKKPVFLTFVKDAERPECVTLINDYLPGSSSAEDAFILAVPIAVGITIQKKRNAEPGTPVQHFIFLLPDPRRIDREAGYASLQDGDQLEIIIIVIEAATAGKVVKTEVFKVIIEIVKASFLFANRSLGL